MVARRPSIGPRLQVIGQDDVADTGHTVPQTASIKVHSTHPLHPRPYRDDPYGDEVPSTIKSPCQLGAIHRHNLRK